MKYYNESKPSDKKIAILAIWLYVVLLAVILLFVRIPLTAVEEKEPILLDMGLMLALAELDAGVQESAPAPRPAPAEEPEPEPEEAVIKKKKKPKKREVKKAALFSSNKGKAIDTLDQRVYSHNTVSGKTVGNAKTTGDSKRNFSLSGRSIVGKWPKPTYDSNGEGRVVVDIQVNKSGKVTKATFRASSSTTNDSALVRASILAATNAIFNSDDSANFLQGGTITYNFKKE